MADDFGVMRAPRAILFGVGERRSVGRVARPLGKRALICTDLRFGADAEMATLRAALDEEGVTIEIFDGTEAELPLAGVLACLEVARDFAPDMVIGVGGGSCLDMAKVVSLMLSHGGPAESFYGENRVPGPVLPVIAISTTSGTGSEVTPVAVLGDSSRALKVGISSPYLIPHTAICDPELHSVVSAWTDGHCRGGCDDACHRVHSRLSDGSLSRALLWRECSSARIG